MSSKRRPVNPVPVFANEDAERAYWAKEDLTERFDWESAVETRLPELQPSMVSISIRLPISLLVDLKSLANARDVPYQSLMQTLLAEQVARIRRG